MQNIFTNIKCSEIILYNANENWYIILYDLFSRLCYIATCGPFCKDATHMVIWLYGYMVGCHCDLVNSLLLFLSFLLGLVLLIQCHMSSSLYLSTTCT